MAFRAGAAVTQMEKSGLLSLGTGYKHKWYAAIDASFEHLAQIDDNGKPIPAKVNLREAVLKGESALPFWGDFPSQDERWRKICWDMMYAEESTTKAIRRKYQEAGFDPSKDLFPTYTLLEGTTPAHFRSPDSMNTRGGPVVDWDLKLRWTGYMLPANRCTVRETTAMQNPPADMPEGRRPIMPSEPASR